MEVFLQIVMSFPTVAFSMLLIVAAAYWVMAMVGLMEIDALDGLVTPEIEGVELEGFAGTMMRFGLGGLPLMLIVTVLLFFAWLLSYFADYMLLRHLPFEWVRWLLGTAVMLAAPIVAVPMTSVALRPLRHFFAKLRPTPTRSFLGMPAVVRSPVVSREQGRATVEDGGAGLILNIRSQSDAGFVRGDRVVLIEYHAADNAYSVVSENEFNGL